MPELSSTWLALLSIVVASYAALLRYTLVQKEKVIEENDAKLTKELETLEGRLSLVSSKQNELSSELQLQALRHDHLLSAFKDVRDSMVTKAEFDVTRRATQDTLSLILYELRRGRSVSQQFHAPKFPSDPPKGK